MSEMSRTTGKASGYSQGNIQICINHPPILGVPCDSRATQDTNYSCQLNGSDEDIPTQNTTFRVIFSNETLFTINGTGYFNFTPASTQIGNNTLNFSLADNSSCSNREVSQLFILSINASGNRPPILTRNISDVTFNQDEIISAFFLTSHFSDPDGDSLTFTVSNQSLYQITIKSTSEVIINATTCGSAATVIFTAMDPSNDTADSNLVTITCNVPSSSTPPPPTTSSRRSCLSQYTCFDYTPCSPEGVRTKRCVDENGCRDDQYITVICKAPQQEECVESWSCIEWGECLLNGKRYRTCSDENHCKGGKDRPKEEQSCQFIPSCFDGLKDGDEIGIDCGGSCKSCVHLETPGFIQEDLKPITYILLILTLLAFGLLMANKYFHKQIHRWLIKSGWYLSGRYDKAILINGAIKKQLFEGLTKIASKMEKGSIENAFERLSALTDEYFRQSKVTPRTSPHYRKSKVSKALPGPLEVVLDFFYGHMKHLNRKGWPDKEVLRFAIEEFRAVINLTSSSEVKVPYDAKEMKMDGYLHPAEKVRLKIINTWIALQFNEVELARERYEELIEVYESLDNRSKLSLYQDVYRTYQEIKYANSILDLET